MLEDSQKVFAGFKRVKTTIQIIPAAGEFCEFCEFSPGVRIFKITNTQEKNVKANRPDAILRVC